MGYLVHYIVGAVFGFLIGLLTCDLSPAWDNYYEQQQRNWNSDITNLQREQQLQREREMIYQQQRRQPC